MAAVRETSTFGPCNVLGPLVRETKTRFVYCPHPGQIAFARARQEFTSNRVGVVRTIRRRATAICCEQGWAPGVMPDAAETVVIR